MLVAAVAALDVVAALYLFGEWVCQLSQAEPGPAFASCRIPALASPGRLSPIAAVLFLSPAGLAAAAGAFMTILAFRDRKR